MTPAGAGRARRVVVVGAAGFTNLGDDAILAAMLAELRSALPGATFAVASGAPERLAGEPGVEPVGFGDADVAAALDGSDLLLVGGGGFVHDYDARLSPAGFRTGVDASFYSYFRAAELGYARGVPVCFYAVEVGPLVTPGGRELVREVMSRAAAVTVRDPLSLHELRLADVVGPALELTADPAVRLPPPATPWAERPAGRVVGLVTRVWARTEARWTESGRAWFERYLGSLAAAADHAVERLEATPVFLPAQRYHDDDLAVAEQVVGRMRHAERARVHEAQGYAELHAALASLDVLVSTRLHPLILAAAAGVPGVGVTAAPKVRAFLCRVGLPELVVSAWAAAPGAVERALDRVLAERDAVAARLADGMDEQRRAAARNPEVAAALVAAG